ncbi:MAG: hypothetical protein LBO02_02155 [Holosporaceae bacterium]|jgi:hypothetical protein|nr:hypothetical protein [Holosporaceae bacterium]
MKKVAIAVLTILSALSESSAMENPNADVDKTRSETTQRIFITLLDGYEASPYEESSDELNEKYSNDSINLCELKALSPSDGTIAD